MTDIFDVKRKNNFVTSLEESGQIADSMDVRRALIAQMNAGELTLAEVASEIKRIKRNARALGKTTRAKAWRQG